MYLYLLAQYMSTPRATRHVRTAGGRDMSPWRRTVWSTLKSTVGACSTQHPPRNTKHEQNGRRKTKLTVRYGGSTCNRYRMLKAVKENPRMSWYFAVDGGQFRCGKYCGRNRMGKKFGVSCVNQPVQRTNPFRACGVQQVIYFTLKCAIYHAHGIRVLLYAKNLLFNTTQRWVEYKKKKKIECKTFRKNK